MMPRRARPETLMEALPGMGRIIRFLLPYLRGHRLLLVAALVALLLGTAARVLEPWPLKVVVDYVASSQPNVTLPDIPGFGERIQLAEIEPFRLMFLAALSLLGIVALRAVMAYCSSIGFALVGHRMMTEVRIRLFRHLQGLSLSFHHKVKTGELTLRVISDVNMLQEVMVTAILPMLANVLVLIGMIGVMLLVNWRLSLLALAPMPLVWMLTLYFGHRIHAAIRAQRRQEGAMAATTSESLTAIRNVQALSLEGVFARVFADESRKSLKSGVRSKQLTANLERVVDVVVGLSVAIVLWQGGRLVVMGHLSPGDLIVFLTYLKNTFRPLRTSVKHASRLARAVAAGERIIDLLDQKADIRDLPDSRPAPPFRGALCFDRVTFGYEPGHPVLRRVTLQIQPGQWLAVVGPSGVGKSTLVGLLLRLHDPEEGRVLIDGVDIREYKLASLRGQISIVLPGSLLFAASVRENIGYGARDASEEEIEQAARLANAHDFIMAMPEGYDTLLGERGATLSSGQRQRLAIARAALRSSSILILDEPTTGLDRANEQAVIDSITHLTQDRTVIMITHDLDLAARADQIAYLEGGKILELGGHAELLAKDGYYAELFHNREYHTHHPIPDEVADAQ
ncbi:MAG: ABC transporter ATP-binding protein [Desulfobulbus sp.]|jgi:ATP-binding cassette subfamily B protein